METELWNDKYCMQKAEWDPTTPLPGAPSPEAAELIQHGDLKSQLRAPAVFLFQMERLATGCHEFSTCRSCSIQPKSEAICGLCPATT